MELKISIRFNMYLLFLLVDFETNIGATSVNKLFFWALSAKVLLRIENSSCSLKIKNLFL